MQTFWYFATEDGRIHYSVVRYGPKKWKVYEAESKRDLSCGNGILQSVFERRCEAYQYVKISIKELESIG